MSKRFNVALSFPGEHRDFVHQVAEEVGEALGRERVFYDEWYETELLGTGGDLKLLNMYHDSDLVIPFFSKFYEKPWCSLEWETIRGILLTRRSEDAVIPVHLDNTKILGWPIVSFEIELRGRDTSGVAGVILKSLYLRVEKSDCKIGKAELMVTPGNIQSGVDPVDTWKRKLVHLHHQEALCSDPNQKFSIQEAITETELRIRELSSNPS